MSRVIVNDQATKMLPKLVAISPYEIYLFQVRSALEAIRFKAQDMEYLPPQLGGLVGQRTITNGSTVLQTIDFEVK